MSPLLSLVLALSAPAGAESFQVWMSRAHRAESRKDDGAAVQYYSNAISSWSSGDGKSGKAKALCARAALREKAGDMGEALKDYTDCLAIERRNAKALDRRGCLLLDADNARDALTDFYAAVKIAPGFAQAYEDRGRALAATGDAAFAREDYRRACKLGLKTSCAYARGAAPPKKVVTGPAPPPIWGPPTPPKSPSRAYAAAARKPAASSHFDECLNGLQACTEDGGSFGECVDKAPACGRKSAPSCCPKSCVKAFHKAVDEGTSEAEAFRAIFKPDAACAKARG